MVSKVFEMLFRLCGTARVLIASSRWLLEMVRVGSVLIGEGGKLMP